MLPRAEAEVVKVEGKRIEFKVSAHDETEEIGRGTHQRMVIDLASFNERLGNKASGESGAPTNRMFAQITQPFA